MRRRCVVKGCCPSTDSSLPQRACYRFPSDPKYKTIWRQKCGTHIRNLISAGICSDHFVDDDYLREESDGTLNSQESCSANIVKRLKTDAVPSRNLPSLQERTEGRVPEKIVSRETETKHISKNETAVDFKSDEVNEFSVKRLSEKTAIIEKQCAVKQHASTLPLSNSDAGRLCRDTNTSKKRPADFEPGTDQPAQVGKASKPGFGVRSLRFKRRKLEESISARFSKGKQNTVAFTEGVIEPNKEPRQNKPRNARKMTNILALLVSDDDEYEVEQRNKSKRKAQKKIGNGTPKQYLDCVMPGCKPRNDPAAPKRRYHCFPADVKYREVWKKICGIKDDSLRFARVCSRHFVEKDYLSNDFAESEYVRDLRKELLSQSQNQIKRLKTDAVPSRYLTSWKKCISNSSYNEETFKNNTAEVVIPVSSSGADTNLIAPTEVVKGVGEKALGEKSVVLAKIDGTNKSFLAARGSSCFVSTCTERPPRTLPNNRPIFHRFPTDPKAKAIWLDKCKNLDTERKEMRVCYRHFRDSDFERDLQSELLPVSAQRKKRLKKDAVPTLNLPGEYQYKKDREMEGNVKVKSWIENNDGESSFGVEVTNRKDVEMISVKKSNFEKLRTEVAEMEEEYRSLKLLAQERVNWAKMYAKEEFSRKLVGHFSLAQIGVFWNPQKSCFWTAKEDCLFAAAADIRSRDGFSFLRNDLNIPLPNLTTLKKYYRCMCTTCFSVKETGKECSNCGSKANQQSHTEGSQIETKGIDAALTEALKKAKNDLSLQWQHVVLPMHKNPKVLERLTQKKSWSKRKKKLQDGS